MRREEHGAEFPESSALPAERKPLKLVLGFLRGLVSGINTILILTIFNHSGWFALLGGVFGMLLYDVLVFVEWLFGRSLGRKKTPRGRTSWARQHDKRSLLWYGPGFLSMACWQ
jgi:hypothetical protein